MSMCKSKDKRLLRTRPENNKKYSMIHVFATVCNYRDIRCWGNCIHRRYLLLFVGFIVENKLKVVDP